MVISYYQIDNILKTYDNQLRRGKLSTMLDNRLQKSADKVQISAEGRKAAIIDNITFRILKQLATDANDALKKDSDMEILKRFEDKIGKRVAVEIKGPSAIFFREIDEKGETLCRLSLEDSKRLAAELRSLVEESIISAGLQQEV